MIFWRVLSLRAPWSIAQEDALHKVGHRRCIRCAVVCQRLLHGPLIHIFLNPYFRLGLPIRAWSYPYEHTRRTRLAVIGTLMNNSFA
jgi:hypothetical protein